MKNYGVVIKYDGIAGTIKGVDSIEYKFLKDDLVDKKEMFKEDKHVEFESQKIEKTDFVFNRANYVKTFKKTKTM